MLPVQADQLLEALLLMAGPDTTAMQAPACAVCWGPFIGCVPVPRGRGSTDTTRRQTPETVQSGYVEQHNILHYI